MEQSPVKTIVRYLTEWLDEKPRVQYEAFGADALVKVGKNRYLIEYEDNADAASVRQAIRDLSQGHDEGFVNIVAVPFMGEVGRRICEEEKTSWVDLSGNADIRADQIRILIHGKPNRFRKRSEFSNVFAPRSSRVTRLLLQYPHTPMRQIDIGRRVKLSRSFVNQIVGRLEGRKLVHKLSDGSIRCDEPDRLLAEWDTHYDFSRHVVLRGSLPAGNWKEIRTLLHETLETARIHHAFTGLAALTDDETDHFDLVRVYVARRPDKTMLSLLRFEEKADHGNVWFIAPEDEGVFHGLTKREGLPCVHPVQCYLDLKALSPESEKRRAAMDLFPGPRYASEIE